MGRHAAAPGALKRACIAGLAALIPLAARADGAELRLAQRLESEASARDPVEWLMAQAQPQPQPQPPAPDAAPPAAATPQPPRLWNFLANDNGTPLRLAPIRWRGNLALEQRETRVGEGGRRSTGVELVNLEVASYIMQPWLATVRANLNLAAYQERSRDEDFSTGEVGASRSQRSGSISGGATVAVFPASRFPFTASLLSTDSRTSGDIASTDTTTRLVTLRQTYRSPLGDQVYGGSFDHSVVSSASFGRDTVSALNGSWQRTLDTQQFDVNGAWSRNRLSAGEGTDLARFAARHSWRPEEALANVESSGSLSLAGFGGDDVRSRFLQLSSFGTWRPGEESPLFLTGGVRFSDSSIAFRGADSDSRVLAGNVAASYTLTPAARLVGSASLTDVRANGVSELVAQETLGASYSPAPLALGPASYAWTAAASESAQAGGVESRNALSLQASHQLSSGARLGAPLSVNGSVTQSFSVQDESDRGLSRTLAHSASVGARWAPTSGSDAYFSVGLGDSRTEGARREHFQLLNVQASGQVQVGSYGAFSANFTVQAIRQRRDGDVAADEAVAGEPPAAPEERNRSVQRFGTLAFTQGRLLGVRNLRLTASATFTDANVESRQLGDATAPHDAYTRLYEALLRYDVGRLEFRLGTRLAKLEGREDRQLFFRVNRQFGIF